MRFAAPWVLVLMTVVGSPGVEVGTVPRSTLRSFGSAELTEERQRQRDAAPLSRERAVVRHGLVARSAAPHRPYGRFGGPGSHGEKRRCRDACAHACYPLIGLPRGG
jgi:hypothetical protein